MVRDHSHRDARNLDPFALQRLCDGVNHILRSGTGTAAFTLTTTGAEALSIVTATRSGTRDSDEILFYLLDKDENVITTAA